MFEDSSLFVLIAAFAGITLLFIFLYFVPVNLWITAQFSNVRVGIGELIGMRIRKVADGIQLVAKARVTVRANIAQLVGGAGEETILARVGEGIVTSIGSAATHKSVLENPDKISKLVLQRGLDAGTAFEILSIDIADIDVGANIGAKLQIDQASADLKVAEAKAEERRAMAVALEQEMKAKNVEMRAKVIEAEAEIPKAIAEAFRSGQLGVMDYYKMENVKSDTAMRDSIANSGKDSKDSGSLKS